MASESGVPDDSAFAPPPPPPAQHKVEEKLEQEKVKEPEKEVEEEVKQLISEESSSLQDQPEDKQVDPPAAAKEEEKSDAPAPEMSPSKEEEELQVKAEPDPDESVAEASANKVEVVEEKAEPSKQKEESHKLPESSEVLEEPEKTSEQKPENPPQEEEKPKQESMAPLGVDEAPVTAAEEEVVEKVEDQGKQEPIPQEQTEPEGQSEVAEIKPRESLGALMRKKEGNQDQVDEERATESHQEVALIEKETQADKKDVEESSVLEAVEKAATEDKGKELNACKEDEEPSEELVRDVKDAGDKLEESEQKPDKSKLEKDFITNGSTQPTEEAQSESTAKDVTEKPLEESVSRKVELPPQSKEEAAERAAPIEIKNGKEEGKPDNVAVTEESEEPDTKEERTPDETIQERGVEAAANPEEQNIKHEDKIKDSQEQPKEEAPTKAVKQSNNLISKVKHSLVKAKKAIIGKSPTSKSVPTETKG